MSDWTAFLAGRTGCRNGREDYLDGLWEYVTEQYEENGGLDKIKATQWHRIALTVTALGADPTCFGKDGEGNPVNLIADGTYAWDRTESLGGQGLNAWIFALLTLDSRGYSVPAEGKYQREDMVEAILNAQEADGGFGLVAGRSDVDMTAMALQALAPYREQCPEAIDRGLDFLSAAQTARGDFEGRESGGAENCAQVVIALCALGVNPGEDPRFVKEGGSAMDGLLLYCGESGAFCHLLGEEENLFATAQGGLALLAEERRASGGGSVYDFSDSVLQKYEYGSGQALWYAIAGALGIGVCAGLLLALKGRKKCTK